MYRYVMSMIAAYVLLFIGLISRALDCDCYNRVMI